MQTDAILSDATIDREHSPFLSQHDDERCPDILVFGDTFQSRPERLKKPLGRDTITEQRIDRFGRFDI